MNSQKINMKKYQKNQNNYKKEKEKKRSRGRPKKIVISGDDTSDGETDVDDQPVPYDNSHNTNKKQISTRSSSKSLSFSIEKASTETVFNISNDGKQLAIYPKGRFALNFKNMERCNIIFEDGSVKQMITYDVNMRQQQEQAADNHFAI
eukprot:43886_1